MRQLWGKYGYGSLTGPVKQCPSTENLTAGHKWVNKKKKKKYKPQGALWFPAAKWRQLGLLPFKDKLLTTFCA